MAAPQARLTEIHPQLGADCVSRGSAGGRHPRARVSPARRLLQVSEMLTEGTIAKEPAASIRAPITREGRRTVSDEGLMRTERWRPPPLSLRLSLLCGYMNLTSSRALRPPPPEAEPRPLTDLDCEDLSSGLWVRRSFDPAASLQITSSAPSAPPPPSTAILGLRLHPLRLPAKAVPETAALPRAAALSLTHLVPTDVWVLGPLEEKAIKNLNIHISTYIKTSET